MSLNWRSKAATRSGIRGLRRSSAETCAALAAIRLTRSLSPLRRAARVAPVTGPSRWCPRATISASTLRFAIVLSS